MTAPCTSRATTSSSTWKGDFPTPPLIPAGHESEVAALLKHEDDLHLDLRTLSFRIRIRAAGAAETRGRARKLCRQRRGHCAGRTDHEKQVQIEFWQRAAKEGFTDERVACVGVKVPCRVRRARQEIGDSNLI